MPFVSREVRPCQKPGHVVTLHGTVEPVPAGWTLVPPGDAALSRRIKADGPSWTVIEPAGRKRFSHGIWAPADRVAALRADLALERADPAYQRQLEAGRRRRQAGEVRYADDFRAAVVAYLAFAPPYAAEATALAALITAHATPVGSGTVARTARIPLESRAEAATFAWLRHQTTGYDTMTIARVRGRRREVRRLLAQRSVQLLQRYRHGLPIDPAACPLQTALLRARPDPAGAPAPAAAPGEPESAGGA